MRRVATKPDVGAKVVPSPYRWSCRFSETSDDLILDSPVRKSEERSPPNSPDSAARSDYSTSPETAEGSGSAENKPVNRFLVRGEGGGGGGSLIGSPTRQVGDEQCKPLTGSGILRWLGLSKKDISKRCPVRSSCEADISPREEALSGPRIPSGLKAGQEIGSGSFANVYLARKKGSGVSVALKFVRHPTGHRPRSPRLREDDPFGLSLRPTSPRTVGECRMMASTARREVEIHRSLEHPNIAQLQSYLLEVDYTALVVEYLPHCLFDLCRKQHQSVVLPNVPTYARHILLAIAYLHSVGVAHRDIKLENILVSGDFRVAKLCDFGLACFYCAGERSKEHCGSPHYAAPELLQGASYEPPVADMWSVGVALFATVYAAMPFQQRDPQQLAVSVATAEIRFPEHPLNAPDFRVPKSWRATLESILDRTPSRRPTAAQALAAPWIQLGT